MVIFVGITVETQQSYFSNSIKVSSYEPLPTCSNNNGY